MIAQSHKLKMKTRFFFEAVNSLIKESKTAVLKRVPTRLISTNSKAINSFITKHFVQTQVNLLSIDIRVFLFCVRFFLLDGLDEFN